jgi:tRNA-modifying protein YgfZ
MTKPESALLDEYAALTHGAGVADLPRSLVALRGRDRATLLHKFCTQDVLGKQPGEGGEAFICNVQGKIVAYVYFFVGDDEILLDSAPGQGEAIIRHLDRYVITEDVTFHDRSAERGVVLLAGPQAAGWLPELAPYGHAPWPLADATTDGELDVAVRRAPLAGNDGYFLETARESAGRVCDHFAALGARLCSAAAVEMVRLEAAAPLYGVDITVENLPQEVQRDAVAINFRKGCYLGQETVARIDALGHVNKLWTPVKFPPAAELAPGSDLTAGEKVVGRVTSAAWSPRHGGPLALAYVRREHTTPGTPLACGAATGEVLPMVGSYGGSVA